MPMLEKLLSETEFVRHTVTPQRIWRKFLFLSVPICRYLLTTLYNLWLRVVAYRYVGDITS